MTVVTIEKAQPGVRAAKKESTRAQLIATAIDLFARNGIDGTTVEQIAAEAGVGKGTVYNYFAAKEDIVVAFIAELERSSLPAVKRFAESRAPLEEILEGFAWQLLKAKRDHVPFMHAFLARMMGPDNRFHDHLVEMQAAIDATLTALFSRLQARGLVRADTDMGDMRMSFKTMHLGLTMLWALEGAPWRETRKVLKGHMAMFAAGVKPR